MFLPPSIEIFFDMKNENGQMVQMVKRRNPVAQSQSKFPPVKIDFARPLY